MTAIPTFYETRYWITGPDNGPFGGETFGLVDEEAGGIVAYYNDLDMALAHCERMNGGES